MPLNDEKDDDAFASTHCHFVSPISMIASLGSQGV
jgi:hypothetical protein